MKIIQSFFRKAISIGMIAAVLLCAVSVFHIHSCAEEEGFVLDYLDNDYSELREPTPLLCILVSFDANGNGDDDYDTKDREKLFADKDSELYGEQWIHSEDEYWSDLLFGEGNGSLKQFYSDMTDGRFYFYPAAENCGTENDGIIRVVLHLQHPEAIYDSCEQDGEEVRIGIVAAANYCDFSVFDKNGDGNISEEELAIVYVYGGYEWAYNSTQRPDTISAFGVRAHYTATSAVTLDGVTVLNSGYCVCGEYMNSVYPITMGTIAHELGHFIGAPDLYDTSTDLWTKYVGSMSLMCRGNHGRASDLKGSNPSYMDPYSFILTGLGNSQTVSDGEYTLYARESTEGDYNILRINTPDPNEYYLVENRYASWKGSYFDRDSSVYQGIVIWHIDENMIRHYGINNKESGHDPGIVTMAPKSITNYECSFFNDPEYAAMKYTFKANSTKYEFPVSGTCFTSLTEEEAESYHMQIEVLDNKGAEMRIVVSGASILDPEMKVAAESGQTSVNIVGTITDLGGGNITSCTVTLKNDKTGEIFNQEVDPAQDGTFQALFSNLDENNTYTYTAIISGDYGSCKKTGTVTTKKTSSVPAKEYAVTLIKNTGTDHDTVEIKVKYGEKLTYQLDEAKEGYKFIGWYTDSACLNRYSLSKGITSDMTLYGKWLPEEETTTLKIVGAEVIYNFAVKIGTKYIEPVLAEKDDVFLGWYSNEECTVRFSFNTLASEEPVTIYAKWLSDLVELPEETTAETETTIPAETTELSESSSVEASADNNGQESAHLNSCGSSISFASMLVMSFSCLISVAIIKKGNESK